MPTPRIYDSGPPLTRAKIASLENRIEGTLPKSYKDFLLQHNGGSTDPEVFKSKDGNPFSNLDIFFGLDIKDRFWDLRKQFRDSRNDLPAGLLPIALDLGGNLICLAFKGKNRGKVYFWDHEGAAETIDPRIEFPWLELGDDYEFKGDDWPGHPDLSLLADRFEDFLNSFTNE